MDLPPDLPPYLHTIALYLDGRGHRRIDILECLLCVFSYGTARSCESLTVLERETVEALIPPDNLAELATYDVNAWTTPI
jgi:hypothetical protein